MAKLPFSDSGPPEGARRSGPASRGGRGAGADDPAPWTVTQAATAIKSAVARGIPRRVRIVGEVSNFADRNHWFFSLKEGKAATLRCVCFASSARRARCRIEDGMEVVATGRIDFFEAQGQTQLYVDRVEPVGQGALELQLRRLLAELREAGYFEASRKKPLPAVPMRVAVVTSRSAAALEDVIQTVRKRFPGVELFLCDVRVQGASAAPEVARAIRALSRDGARLGIQAVIVTRGGGSIEDLWAFNEREVADAIDGCSLPVVAAIGHETDTTVAELVADARCSTPTQAAAVLVPERRTLAHQVNQLGGRLSLVTRRQVEHQRHRLAVASRHPLLVDPRRLVEQARQRTAAAKRRLTAALPRRVEPERERLARSDQRLGAAVARRGRGARDRLDALARHLDAVGPRRVLARGYTYTLGPDGRLLRSRDQIAAGRRITTVLHDGRVHSRVEAEAEARGIRPGDAAPKAPAKPRARGRKKPSTPPGPGLFG